MLDWAKLAKDKYEGFPRGDAKSTSLRLRFTFEKAWRPLGLSKDVKDLTIYLLGMTQEHDWEEGSRPICWPSDEALESKLDLSPSGLNRAIREGCEAGTFAMRDSGNGKRHGWRDPKTKGLDLDITFGFDLSLLAVREKEFLQIADDDAAERRRMTDLKKRATRVRSSLKEGTSSLDEANCPPTGSWSMQKRPTWSPKARSVAPPRHGSRSCAAWKS